MTVRIFISISYLYPYHSILKISQIYLLATKYIVKKNYASINHESQSRVQSVTLLKYFEIRLPKTRILRNSKILESKSPLFYPYKVKWADIFTTVKDMDMIWISSQNEILYHISYLKISLDIISYQKSLFEILYRIWYEKDMKRYISLTPLG